VPVRSNKVKCLVSGATGFIGRELCQQLAGCGASLVALSRRGGSLFDGTATHAVDFVSQQLDARLLQGVEVVFHLAGIAHQQANDEAYERVNHMATLALAELAAAAGVKCFVYLSSVKAMGPPGGGAGRNEHQRAVPTDAYGLSKLRAEQDLQTRFSNSGMAVVILRPALVYGATAKGNLLLLSRAVRAGLPRPPALGGRSMIAVHDLARLMCQLASDPPLGVHTWIVCDGQRYSAQRIYDLMRENLGKPPATDWVPLWLWRLAAFLRDGMRHKGADSSFIKLFGTELYSSDALLREVPWRPQLELADVVPQMMSGSGEASV